MLQKTFVFGYGSLMSEEGLHRTLPGKKKARWATLKGWCRVFDQIGSDNDLYLNIRIAKGQNIKGVLLEVNNDELKLLEKRETWYQLVEVTRQIINSPNGVVYAFVAPPKEFVEGENYYIRDVYLKRCLADMPKKDQLDFLEEVELPTEVQIRSLSHKP